jgi:hypothetical protein
MRALGPCLTAETRSDSERFKVPGEDGWWCIDEYGRLSLAGPSVKYVGGKPVSAIAPNQKSMEELIEKLGVTPTRREVYRPKPAELISNERSMIHWRIEVAALKSILLTFDHLLRADPNRFTRSTCIEPVRRFIHNVTESNLDGEPTEALAEYSLGLQYDQDYLDLFESLRAKAALPKEPFRHTLIVSANIATRTLDAVFWAFECDPHAFRLTKNWQGEPFTFVMTNGILAGQLASAVVSLPETKLLGRYNNRRNRMAVRIPLTEQEKENAGNEIMDRRMTLYREAVDYIERNHDKSVTESVFRKACS